MGAKNIVLAGDYKGKGVGQAGGKVYLVLALFKTYNLDKQSVESFDLITDEMRKSASSGILRGAVGATILGPVGLLAGLSAKNKGIYTIAVKFRDGKNSLIEVDEKIYKVLLQTTF